MKTPTNKDRAGWAAVALETFADATGMHGENDQTKAIDLLANLIHLLGPEVFERALKTGRMHHEAEVHEEQASEEELEAGLEYPPMMRDSEMLDNLLLDLERIGFGDDGSVNGADLVDLMAQHYEELVERRHKETI